MNICVLFSLLLLLAPGGCPIYSIDLSTLEVPNDFQNELTLQSMLSSEMHQSRNTLNSNADINGELDKTSRPIDPFDRNELMRNIEDRIKATYYAAASPDEPSSDEDMNVEQPQTLTQHSESFKPEEREVFMGTNLFGNYPKRCFSTEEIALMSARRDFELLVPKAYPQTLLHDSAVYTLMKYFNSVNQVIKRMSDLESRRLLQRAFYDALGGYLRYYLVPVAQVSYYAGRLKLCTVQRLVALFHQCQLALNTNGNAWKLPEQDIVGQLKNVHIVRIQLNESRSTESDATSCALLDHSCGNGDAKDELMIVPLPHLELEDGLGFLSNIFLPFKHRRIFNLRSPDAAFILVKFFKTLSNCYRFQGMSQRPYNQKLRIWIRENLQLHYRDEMFYPGLGGVLQIYETLTAPTKEPAHANGLEPEVQEPLLSDADVNDYDMAADDLTANEKNDKAGSSKQTKGKSKNVGKKTSKKQREKENAAGHIQSRLARHGEKQGEDEPKPNEAEASKLEKDENEEEECIDCDEDSYVGYAAAILALLLLLLLIIICCCLHRSRNQEKDPKKKPKPKLIAVPATDKPAPKEPQPPVPIAPPPPPPQPEDEQSCWSTMFKRKKKSKRREAVQPKPTPELQLIPGMRMVGNQRSGHFSGSMGYNDVEKLLPHKNDAKESKYDENSFTSTSSLGYQFRRKFIPISMGINGARARESRDDYYAKSDKKRSKAGGKKSAGQRDRDKDRDQNTQDPREGQRMRDRESNAAVLFTKEERPRKMSGKVKTKRQEGGLAYSHERERQVEMKRSESDTNLKVPPQERELDRERRSSVHSNIVGAPATYTINIKPETQPENSETKSLPLSSPTHSVGVCQQSSRNTGSWETTFDDDDDESNSMYVQVKTASHNYFQGEILDWAKPTRDKTLA